MTADTALGSTAFVLAGGGTKGSFEVGALQYLIGTERIIPDVITATSAGAVAASVLAQARTFDEFALRVQEVEDDILAMTRTEQVFGEQSWLRALEGTALSGQIRLALTQGTRPPVPALAIVGIEESMNLAPVAPVQEPRSPKRAAKKARRRRRRRAQRLLAGASLRLPKARRKLRTSGNAVLNLRPLAEAIRHGGPSGIHPVDPNLVARPGLQLRLAVTALRAGVLRYVTEDGTLVDEDAVTPVPGKAGGPVDFIDGVIASASVPLVFPPRPLADDDYVDGGVLQIVPVRAAVQLGARRIIAVLAMPLQIEREDRSYSGDTAVNVGLRALGAIAMADRQRENLGVVLPAGASLTTVDPVIDVVGFFEIEPGLLRINKDYGWLRAADVMTEGDPTLLADIAADTHRLVAARLQAWHLEETVWEDDRICADADAGTISLLRELKRQVRDIVDQRKQLGFPVPDGCEAWWTGVRGPRALTGSAATFQRGRPGRRVRSRYAERRTDGFVHVRGATEHNLRDIDVDIPRQAMVAFTGISGSGKSSLAFGTLYAEAQRRYLESVAPYVRRLLHQVGAPHVRDISGLPPAVALEQRRSAPTSRSTVGTITTLSNLLRMLYSRAGTYPRGAPRLEAEAFSPNTAAGACPRCHGLGVVHDVTVDLLVPDASLSIRQGAIAAWPGAWQGANLRSIVSGLGIDIDAPWRKLKKKDREWLLFTEEQPSVLIEPERDRVDYGYYGKFWSARKHIMHVLADSKSQQMRDRAMRFVESVPCSECHGSGLRPEALAVTFAGRSIAEVNDMALTEVAVLLRPVGKAAGATESAVRISADLVARIEVLLELGLGYLGLGRRSTTLSPGEAQRLRIGTELRSGLFGVVYVLDEPSAGLHPADAEPLLAVLDRLKASGNSLFVVEHDMDVVRRADWVVDIGPGAGEDGGRVLYSGAVAGLEQVEESATSRHLFGRAQRLDHTPRSPQSWLHLGGVSRHNLHDVSVDIPLGVLTVVTGVSGSGKSTLVTQVLGEVMRRHLGRPGDSSEGEPEVDVNEVSGLESLDRLVRVDQRPIGRTPRSNLATYTGMFDAVRKVYASTDEAQARGYTAGRFSFNVPEGRCETCEGEGFVAVELLFLPGTYSPCPTCHGARYNVETLEVTYRGKSIADVLALSVDQAAKFLVDIPAASRSLETLREVGLGYLRLGQPATELSGGEAQRIKLATELQRSGRGHTLFLLDEPTDGLHPEDVALLLRQLHRLVAAGNTVVLVEHDLDAMATADWLIDLGPGGGEKGGTVVATGPPATVATTKRSVTAPYLAIRLRKSR